MDEPKPFDLAELPSSTALTESGLKLVQQAITGLQDLGLGEAAIFYHLLYPAMIHLLPIEHDREATHLAPEIARSLVAIAANEVGAFCDPDEFRDLAYEFERIAKEARSRESKR